MPTRKVRYAWLMAAGWFVVQAADELFFGNTIVEGRAEYLLLVGYVLASWYVLKRYIPDEPTEARRDKPLGR